MLPRSGSITECVVIKSSGRVGPNGPNYHTTPTTWENTPDLQGHWVPEQFAKSRIALTSELP